MIDRYYPIVEMAITNLGVKPEDCLSPDQAGLWNLKKGSATIDIRLFTQEANGKVYCLVSAWVARVPQSKKAELFEELLELNGRYVGVSFCKINNEIFVIADREAEGMDQTELSAMVHRVSNVADHYDDVFKQQYPVE